MTEQSPADDLATMRTDLIAGMTSGYVWSDPDAVIDTLIELARAGPAAENDEYDQLVTRLRDLLVGTANALKGDPGPLTLHDWSDLPTVAAAVVAENLHIRDSARRLVAAAKAWRNMAMAEPTEDERARTVNNFAEAIDAFDPMLSETTEASWRPTAERERDRLLAAMKYLRACAHLFPHTNTNREHKDVGLPDDAPGAWCLGCTVAATADYVADLDAQLLSDDEDADDERARQWVRDYENRPPDDEDDTPPRKPPPDRVVLEAEVMQLRHLLARTAFYVAPPDQPIELVEIEDTPDRVHDLVLERNRLQDVLIHAFKDLSRADAPPPAVVLGVTSYLRAALARTGPDNESRTDG